MAVLRKKAGKGGGDHDSDDQLGRAIRARTSDSGAGDLDGRQGQHVGRGVHVVHELDHGQPRHGGVDKARAAADKPGAGRGGDGWRGWGEALCGGARLRHFVGRVSTGAMCEGRDAYGLSSHQGCPRQGTEQELHETLESRNAEPQLSTSSAGAKSTS